MLDRLAEEPSIVIEGISATSAGAMNAAVFAQGMTDGGPDGARAALEAFWSRISELGLFSPIRRHPMDWVGEAWGLEPLNYTLFNAVSRLFSPYQLNPFNWNPLRDVLAEQIDFDRLARSCGVKLFISATNVRSGKNRVFDHHELSPDVLLASACLPFLFQAVEIDGEAYWDGGYMGNPAIYPLIYRCGSRDVAIVQINPLAREEVPKTAVDILDRVNEISFNSTLMREMRAIAFVSKLIDQKALDPKGYKRMNIHLIEDEQAMKAFGVASKLSPEPQFLIKLRDIGRAATERWLNAHRDDIGRRSSLDIAGRFL